MSDADKIHELTTLLHDSHAFHDIQHTAALKLAREAHLRWPHDACAITLSCELQRGGIDVPDTLAAFAMVSNVLPQRGWTHVPNGEQKPGDVGTTCGSSPHHGVDHVYYVMQVIDRDHMIIADNQSSVPHARFVSGRGGKSPTTHFMRAP